MKMIQKWLSPSAILATVATVLSGLGGLLIGKKILGHCLNSDSLYLTCVYKDLFVDGGALKHWILSPAPCYFPDMVLLFPLLKLSPDLGLGMVFYGMSYLFLLGALMVIVSRNFEVPGGRSWLYASVSVLLLVAIFQDGSRFVLDEYMMVAGRHGGTLISGLVVLALVMRMLRHGVSIGAALALLGVTYCALLSDTLFIPQVLVPSGIALVLFGFFRLERSRTIAKILIIFLVSYFIFFALGRVRGQESFWAYLKLAESNFHFSAIWEKVKLFSSQMKQYLRFDKPSFQYLLIVWFFYMVGFVKGVVREKEKVRENIQHRMMLYLFFYATLSVVGSVLSPLVVGVWTSTAEIRYIIPLFILPIFTLSIVGMVYFHPYHYAIKSGALLAIFLFGIVRIVPGALALRWNDLQLPYPDAVRFVDETVRENGLKYGYCDYWNANYIRVLSRANVQVNSLHPVLWPYFWINNRDWYWFPHVSEGIRYPEYTFIITDRLEKDRIEKAFGPPAWVKQFANQHIIPGSDTDHADMEIYGYNRESDRAFRNWIRFFFLGDEDPSRAYCHVFPPFLDGKKFDETPWDAEWNTRIEAGSSLEVQYEFHPAGDMIELSVDCNDEYELTFYRWVEGDPENRKMEETLVIPARSGEGLRVYYLPLPDTVANVPIAKMLITPRSGDGHYSVGHAWIYSDPYTPSKSNGASEGNGL